MDIPLDADVFCQDGLCGQSTYLIVDPTTRQVTHLVLREQWFPHAEYLVPVERIVESTAGEIRLDCTRHDIFRLEPFIETDYVEGDLEDFEYAASQYRMWPYVLPESPAVLVENERVPPGELAIRRGTPVQATDGRAGQVDEFLVDPESGQITHLVLREGHLWGQKDVTIPISEIDRIKENTVYLKLDKSQVEALPTIPVRR
jgi:sporulation protein YlmC with PRC-barrel domain